MADQIDNSVNNEADTNLKEAFNLVRTETENLCRLVYVIELLEKLLNSYIEYSNNATYSRGFQRILARVPFIGQFIEVEANDANINSDTMQQYLSKLSLISAQIPIEVNLRNHKELSSQLKVINSELRIVKNEIESQVERVCIRLNNAAYPVKWRGKVLESRVSQIHHPEIKEEAKTYLDVFNQIATSLETHLIIDNREIR